MKDHKTCYCNAFWVNLSNTSTMCWKVLCYHNFPFLYSFTLLGNTTANQNMRFWATLFQSLLLLLGSHKKVLCFEQSIKCSGQRKDSKQLITLITLYHMTWLEQANKQTTLTGPHHTPIILLFCLAFPKQFIRKSTGYNI